MFDCCTSTTSQSINQAHICLLCISSFWCCRLCCHVMSLSVFWSPLGQPYVIWICHAWGFEHRPAMSQRFSFLSHVLLASSDHNRGKISFKRLSTVDQSVRPVLACANCNSTFTHFHMLSYCETLTTHVI